MKRTFITTIANNGLAPVSIRSSSIREIKIESPVGCTEYELRLITGTDKSYLYDTYKSIKFAEEYRTKILNTIG